MKEELTAYVIKFYNEKKYAPVFEQVGDHLGFTRQYARQLILSTPEMEKYYPKTFETERKRRENNL